MDIKANETAPIKLVINKSQSMLLSLAMSILPEKMDIEDVMKMGEGDKGGIGGLLGMSIMMLTQVVDKDEREKMKEALKEGHDYVNPEVTTDEVAREFVSKAAYQELLDLTMKTHGKMYAYGIGARGDSMVDGDVLPEDQAAFDVLVNAHKLLK